MLTFTASNWNIPQTVTLSAVDDSVPQGTHTGLVTHTVTSADPNYNGIGIPTVNLSVWHRDPHGQWTFYQDQPPELACARYFGAEVDKVRQGPNRIDWTGAPSIRGPRL